MSNMDCVRPRIYISSFREAHDIDLLIKYKISHCLVCGPAEELSQPFSKNSNTADKLTLEYRRLPIEDVADQDILEFISCGLDFIDAALSQPDAVVLVHCVAGISRSACVVMGYLMKSEQLEASSALAAVKQERPRVSPNASFMQQLEMFQLMGCRVDKTSALWEIHLGNIEKWHNDRSLAWESFWRRQGHSGPTPPINCHPRIILDALSQSHGTVTPRGRVVLLGLIGGILCVLFFKVYSYF